MRTSGKLTPASWTSTRTCPASRVGSGTSSTMTVDGPPRLVTRAALMPSTLVRGRVRRDGEGHTEQVGVSGAGPDAQLELARLDDAPSGCVDDGAGCCGDLDTRRHRRPRRHRHPAE